MRCSARSTDLPCDRAARLCCATGSTRQQYYEQAAKFLLQEGGEHWSCGHPGIVRELLWLWLFPAQKTVQFLQKTLAAQAAKCLRCAVALHSARGAALGAAGASDGGSAGGQDALRDAIRAWDVARLTKSFEACAALLPNDGASPDHSDSRLQDALCPHVEFMLQPGLLLLDNGDGQRLNASFACSLSALVRGDLSISGAQQLPGLYLLCVHSSAVIRNWARGQVLAMGAIEHSLSGSHSFQELHEVFDVLVDHCERLTMMRNGYEQGTSAPLPPALSNDECEVWKGLVVAIRQLAPWIVRDRLLPRYRGLLPLAFMSVMENSPSVLSAAQCVLYVMRCLGRAFWQDSVCSFSPATLRRVLANLAKSRLVIVPVRHVSLELLEEVAISAGHLAGDAGSAQQGKGAAMPAVCDDVVTFLSSRELRSGPASHAAVTAMATRVLTRVLQRLIDRGGVSELPIKSSAEWAPHVVGTACSPSLPELSRAPSAGVLARIVCLQAASIESTLLRSEWSQQAVGRQGAAEEHGIRGIPDSAMWLESVWSWLLEHAGAENIPEQVHVALLQAVRLLLIWPIQTVSRGDERSSHVLRRFTTLVVPYLQSLAATQHLPASLGRMADAQQVFFELALVQHKEAKAALREFAYRALGLDKELSTGHGFVPALQAVACRNPAAMASSMRHAFEHVKQMGLDTAAFSTLHQLFLLMGQIIPFILVPLFPETRQALLQDAWELTQAFIDCRARLRTDSAIQRHGGVALDSTSSSFFTCFGTLWPNFSQLIAGFADAGAPSDDEDFDDRPEQSLASAHASWLPAFAKVSLPCLRMRSVLLPALQVALQCRALTCTWICAQWGGIASVVVRRHWCSCMVSILSTLRQHGLSLTSKEKTIMDKLVARRDLWTDDQYLALCTQMRPLGSQAVRGNVGMGFLDDLPGASRAGRNTSSKSLVDLTRDSAPANGNAARNRSKEGDSKSNQPRAAKRKKRSNLRGANDSLSDRSSDDERIPEVRKTNKKLVQKKPTGGLKQILADMGCGSSGTRSQSGAEPSISAMLKVGGHVVHAGGAVVSKDWQLDALGARTRRYERTVDELVDDFLSHVLWWDLRQKIREGPPCLSVPASFESLDQYEDILKGLLLEETWEQIQTSFQEERTQIEDPNADFGAMRVISYNEISEFAFAAVRPDCHAIFESGGVSAGAGTWGSGLNEMDLVMLVSPDSFADLHVERPGAGQDSRQGQRKAKTEMEHALALVEKAERGDSESGVVRLKILLRQTSRNKRFCARLGRLSALHSGGSQAHLQSRDAVLSDFDKREDDALPKLRMVCLNYSIATAQREYVALHRLRALQPSTQRAVLAPCLAVQTLCPSKGNLAVVSRDTLNEDQYSAISKCLEPGPFFTLIQGPPGTGKTSTLLGLLASLLAGPSGQVQMGARVLVCAPSNAAVDELAKRVSMGLSLHGRTERYRPSVVRVGAKRQMRPDVWDTVGLEQQVQRRLAQLKDEQQSAKEELDKLKKEVDSLTERIEKCEPETETEESSGQTMGSLLSARKHALALCAQKAALAGVSESRKDVLKRQLRTQLLENAQIVCATLSGAGTSLLQSSMRPFDAVIVDEAAQALEPSVLIPLQLNVDRCILVGDPQQLPATVTSRKADENLYARSLFERLQASGHGASLLTVQYRMHPSIRAFPSQHFYGGKLKDCVAQDRCAPWHADCRFAPFIFYDIKGDLGDQDVRRDSRPGGTSRSNPIEAKACVALLEAMTRTMQSEAGHFQKRVAVMSPYRRQCSDIRHRLAASGLQDVEVSSVDAFQGREMDVSVLSCVRSGRGGLGFVADVRRLNVALTRARCSLLIIGDADTLSQNEHWAALIAHARSARCCVRISGTQLDQVFGGSNEEWRTDSWPESWLSTRG